MEQPTGAQKKEFWEWCGLKELRHERGTYFTGLVRCGAKAWARENLYLDLNNLFKYTVPKLYYVSLSRSDDEIWVAEASLHENDLTQETYCEGDPALALFWAIWEAIKGGSQDGK